MKHLRLAIGCALSGIVFATAGCKPKPKAQVVGEPVSDQSPSASGVTSPSQEPSSTSSPIQASETKAEQVQRVDLPALANRVQPAVILVTVFDSSGKLLRSETGFFISEDGRFVTTAHAIENGAHAVAKAGDGGIYNVAGILSSSSSLDLAILKADVKRVPRVPFLALDKNTVIEIGRRVEVIGSTLSGSEGAPREETIAAKQPESQGDRLEIAMPMSVTSAGSPVVDENAEVIGIVTSVGEKATIWSSAALASLQSQIAPGATARWPGEMVAASPSPRPTPKPRLVYAPQPEFPADARTRSGIARSGRFRVTFDASGSAKNVQIIQSTGNGVLDQATISTLRQWKSTPGHEWFATVPITFQD
jgi:TonB family protein